MSPNAIKRFTRAELYDLVWSQPMTKIASSFGFSDVWLKKICNKHDIPVPGRGYWRRIETGKRGRKPTLRTLKEEEAISIAIHQAAKEKSVSDLEAVEAQKIFEQRDENRIRVPDILERPHSITAATRKNLRAQKPDEYGMLKCAQPGLFSIRVGPASVDRALCILDALLKAADRRGFRVENEADERAQGHVLVNGEAISFLIDEPSERNAHHLTDVEKARQAKGMLWGVQTYDYVPTGKLTLRVQTPYSSGIQGTFRDIARKRVEERLNEVIVAMVHVAEWTKVSRQKHAEKQSRVDAENARRADIRRRQQDVTGPHGVAHYGC